MPQQGYQDRNEAFGEGSLSQQGQEYNSMVPRTFTPTSPLHQLMPSGNGMSAADQNRMLIGGGMLMSSNGMAPDTYQAKRPFMSTTIGG